MSPNPHSLDMQGHVSERSDRHNLNLRRVTDRTANRWRRSTASQISVAALLHRLESVERQNEELRQRMSEMIVPIHPLFMKQKRPAIQLAPSPKMTHQTNGNLIRSVNQLHDQKSEEWLRQKTWSQKSTISTVGTQRVHQRSRKTEALKFPIKCQFNAGNQSNECCQLQRHLKRQWVNFWPCNRNSVCATAWQQQLRLKIAKLTPSPTHRQSWAKMSQTTPFSAQSSLKTMYSWIWAVDAENHPHRAQTHKWKVQTVKLRSKLGINPIATLKVTICRGEPNSGQWQPKIREQCSATFAWQHGDWQRRIRHRKLARKRHLSQARENGMFGALAAPPSSSVGGEGAQVLSFFNASDSHCCH